MLDGLGEFIEQQKENFQQYLADQYDIARNARLEALEDCQVRGISDWATIKSAMKGEMSRYLYRKTKRNPMILPVIMEV